MDYAKVACATAEKARQLISRLGALDTSRCAEHSRSYVYFPVIVTDAKTKKLISRAGVTIVDRKGPKPAAKVDYRAELHRILGKDAEGNIAKGYELLGDIAIIEISGLPRSKEKEVARALVASDQRIRTVLAKVGGVYGLYRKRRLRHVFGAKNYTALYKENGCTFSFDVRNVFFSSKLSYERSRVSQLVRDSEHVVVVGAGVGPFAIEIAKAHPDTEVIGIEPNRHAYDSMLDNIKINKTPNVKAVLGKVEKVYRRYSDYADRIIVPMPTTSLRFLDEIAAMARKKAVTHLYVFGGTDSVLEDSWRKIKECAKQKGYFVKRIDHRIVRPYSAKEVEIVVDFRIEKR